MDLRGGIRVIVHMTARSEPSVITPHFLTPKQLASRWQCSLMKLRRMRARGELPVSYIGRSARYAMADVQRVELEARA